MALVSADVNVETIGPIASMGFSANAADTYFRGAIVWIDTGGGAQVGTMGAGDVPLGISLKNQVIATAGDEVEVCIAGLVGLPTALAATDEGGRIGFDAGTITDNIADAVMISGLTIADNDVILGRLLRVRNSLGFIQIGSETGGIFIAAQDAFV